MKKPILMAQIGAPHGVKGEVRVKPFNEDPLALDAYGSLYDKDGRKFKIMRLRAQKTMLVVKFKGVSTREEAEALNRVELFIDRSMLPDVTEEDEFYVQDLIGCDVLENDGTRVGNVMAVPDFGAGDLLEIAPLMDGGGLGSNTWFLEFTQANVPVVDLENRRIIIAPPTEISERDPDE
ncbi:ribosome maturation factor RimM [Pseudahrensia aquimaris]|uniref:Ribosome maturation factor RimM n=1 Tax=Pseudahrensia aquimaris TaxID=744461 RepID=A0ABW3FCN2_9HYPH